MTSYYESDRRGAERKIKPGFLRFRCVGSECEFPGRCVNVSSGGAYLYAPGSSALQVGHSVWVQFKYDGKKTISVGNGIQAIVTRVGDELLESDGKLCVGLQFLQEQNDSPTA
ncbi:MAG: PilZ domain-containing protein [Phycisphaerae bacterium]|nr:PilZ domain-containing protein [Phycisphaerae bacterium]